MQNLDKLPADELVQFIQSASEPEKSAYAEELIRRFEPLLRKTWYRVARTSSYQDFAQDVFVKLFGGLPSLKNAKAFPGYFRKIALSVAITTARKASKLHEGMPDQLELIESFDDELITKIFVRSYLEHLPSRERQVLDLALLEELSNTQIATKIGLSESAVRATKTRGFKKLRANLLRDAKLLEEKKQGR